MRQLCNADGLELEWLEPGGYWEEAEDVQFSQMFADDAICEQPTVFLDVGAAFGYYSILARRVSSCVEIHAVNPHPLFASQMLENIAANNVRDIHVHQFAVTDRAKKVNIDYGCTGHTYSNASTTNDGIDGSSSVIVNAASLDMFYIDQLAGKTIVSIKMDIEGGEVGALRGASSLLQGCKVKHWSVSTHGRDQFFAVGRILSRAGYTICSNTQVPEFAKWNYNGFVSAACDGRCTPLRSSVAPT